MLFILTVFINEGGTLVKEQVYEIEANICILPEELQPYRVTVNLKTDNKSFEARLNNEAKDFSFYYYKRNLLTRLFKSSKYAFQFTDMLSICRIPEATIPRVFDYVQLLNNGFSVGFYNKDEADTFSSEIKEYLADHIEKEYSYFNKLVQESTAN